MPSRRGLRITHRLLRDEIEVEKPGGAFRDFSITPEVYEACYRFDLGVRGIKATDVVTNEICGVGQSAVI
jgi:hypothetical protein